MRLLLMTGATSRSGAIWAWTGGSAGWAECGCAAWTGRQAKPASAASRAQQAVLRLLNGDLQVRDPEPDRVPIDLRIRCWWKDSEIHGYEQMFHVIGG